VPGAQTSCSNIQIAASSKQTQLITGPSFTVGAPCFSRTVVRPILAWLKDRVIQHSRVSNLVVLYHHESDRLDLAAAVGHSNVELVRSHHHNKLRAVADCVRVLGVKKVALVKLATALAPADIVLHAYEHHLAQGNSYTTIDGLPSSCTPTIFDHELLLALDELSVQGMLQDPDQAVSQLNLIRENTGQDLPVRLKSIPLQAVKIYKELESSRVPRSATLSSPNDFQTASQVIAKIQNWDTEPHSPLLLCEWKTVTTATELAQRSIRPFAGYASGHRHSSQKRQTRVVYISTPSAFSGAEESLCSLIKFIDRDRFELFGIITREGAFSSKLRGLGVEVMRIEANSEDDATVPQFLAITACLRKMNPDIIHINGAEGPPVLYSAAALGIPVVQHIRNGVLGGFEDGILSAAHVIAVSDFLRQKVLSFPVQACKVTTIYDEVDTADFVPGVAGREEARSHFGLSQDAKVVLMIARIADNKRHDLILKAASKLRHDIPELRLVLKADAFGDSFASDRIGTLIEELQLSDIIVWVDFISDIRELFAAADVLVLCSDREGLGRCVVEAMAMEVPVVVTDSGGTHEIVSSNVCGGFVVRGGDADELAARTRDLLGSRHLRRRLGRAGRQYVQTHLDARLSAKAVMGIYESIRVEVAGEQGIRVLCDAGRAFRRTC
ncbi:MAG: glycosyltransferase family 4 protein, partial [Terriglobales bacterium]